MFEQGLMNNKAAQDMVQADLDMQSQQPGVTGWNGQPYNANQPNGGQKQI